MSGVEVTDVELSNAHVSGELLLNGKVAGTVGCYRTEVDGPIYMGGGGSISIGPINCRIARIKGDLMLINGEFKGTFDLTGAEITLNNVRWSDGVTLVLNYAQIGHIPDFAVTWAPRLELNGLTYRSTARLKNFRAGFVSSIITCRSPTISSPQSFILRANPG
jgi:hypothetical protein